MRMCLAFSDHNKSWSMPCRIYHHNRQGIAGRQREQCVFTASQQASTEQEKELLLLCSV